MAFGMSLFVLFGLPMMATAVPTSKAVSGGGVMDIEKLPIALRCEPSRELAVLLAPSQRGTELVSRHALNSAIRS